MVKTFSVICLLIYSANLHAQTVMTADRTDVRIGDQIKATITTNLTDGREWRNLEEVWPDSIPGIEVVSGPEIDNKNPGSARYTWLVSVFDTGWVRIPPLPVVIRKGNQIDTFMTNDIPIQVSSVEPDSSGLAGIKDIARQPFSIWYYKKYWPHALILLLAAIGIWYWWKRRKRPVEVIEEKVPELLPHEWAFKSLAELEQQKLWQTGEVKEHYTILTAILRSYLERRYGITAMEQTSDEILQQLHYQKLSPELLKDTQELLSVADLIKFAKADPGVNMHAAAIDRVRRFVEETMIVTPLIETEIQKTGNEAVE